MIRTSPSQFEVIVDFMERNGDLNKPAEGPHGRLTAINKWQELSSALNLDTAGIAKSVDKWKKVWSDLKNNTKRKASKIHRAAGGTGGGPASTLTLTDLEQRVLTIIGSQAATGLDGVEEIGLELVGPSQLTVASIRSLLPEEERSPTPNQANVQVESIIEEDDWNKPDEGSQSTPFQSEMVEVTAAYPTPNHVQSPTRRPNLYRRVTRGRRRSLSRSAPAPLRTRRSQQHVDAFLDSDQHWRNLATEFTTESLRLREVELQQQTQWQTLFAKFINVLENYTNKHF